MSGASEELELLAAEYVLGTLEPDFAQRAATRAALEPALAAAIGDWEERLAPLAALTPPVTPPPALWERLATSIGAPSTPARTPVLRRLGFWRAGTAIGFALAAAFAGILFLRHPQPGPMAALVPPNGTPAAFIAETQPNGTIRLIPLQPVQVAADRDLELWALPPGATRPVSLGVIPPSGRSVAPPRPESGGTQLMVSLEPRGGSKTGAPTGPVLWGGTLRRAD